MLDTSRTPIRAAIIGSTGYGGVELIRLLRNHPNVKITSVVSSSASGKPMTEGYPHLQEIITDRLDAVDVSLIQEKADLVFLATPAGVSAQLSPSLLEAGLSVIDLSGDFRLKNPADYEEWYKREPADPRYLEQAVYGLSEVFGEEVKGEAFISNPGCYPTAALLGMIPAIQEGWITPESLIIDAKSAVSGAGRSLSLGIHYSEINENFRAYKVNQHQHTPEIEQVLSRIAGRPIRTTFTTHLVPMTRGILCTMYATQTNQRPDQEWVDLYQSYYAGRPFVRIRPAGTWPSTKEVSGSNYCDVGFASDERTGRITIISVIDNLVKGAAGQAIQNMNLMLGLDEATGLHFVPVYP